MTDEAWTKLLMRYSFASCFALETQSCIVEPWRVDSEEQSRNPAAFPGLGLYLEEYFLQRVLIARGSTYGALRGGVLQGLPTP